MTAWPGTLPQGPLGDGWSQQLANNKYEFKPRQGRPLSRLASTQNLDEQEVSFLFTAAQKATFETFYKTTISWGVSSFNWVDPTNNTTYEFQITSQIQYSTPDAGLHYVMRCTMLRVS